MRRSAKISIFRLKRDDRKNSYKYKSVNDAWEPILRYINAFKGEITLL